MPSEVESALRVLSTISSEPIDKLLDTLAKDAAYLDQQIADSESRLLNLLKKDTARIEELVGRVDTTIKVLEEIRSQDKKTQEDPSHWANLALGFMHSLQTTITFVRADLLKSEIRLFNLAVDFYHKIRVPVRREVVRPSTDEKFHYFQRILLDLIGNVPVAGEILSAITIANTIQEWKNHKFKFEEALTKIEGLVGFWAVIDYMKEEGLASMKDVVEIRESEAKQVTAAVDALYTHHRNVLNMISSRHERVKNLVQRFRGG